MTSAPPSLEKRRILLVDDEAAILRMFEHALVRAGFEVDATSSALAARSLLTRRQYDALVTDRHMPEMDGLDLAKVARAMSARLPILMVTGYVSPEASSGLLAVVDAVLTKPVPLSTLVSAIDTAIIKRRAGPVATQGSYSAASTIDKPVVVVTGDGRQSYRLSRLVKELGCAVEAVSSLDELARIAQLQALVLDARCAEGEGIRAVWRLMGRYENLKVLYLSPDGQPADSAKAIGLGATAQGSLAMDDKTLGQVLRATLIGVAKSAASAA